MSSQCNTRILFAHKVVAACCFVHNYRRQPLFGLCSVGTLGVGGFETQLYPLRIIILSACYASSLNHTGNWNGTERKHLAAQRQHRASCVLVHLKQRFYWAGTIGPGKRFLYCQWARKLGCNPATTIKNRKDPQTKLKSKMHEYNKMCLLWHIDVE